MSDTLTPPSESSIYDAALPHDPGASCLKCGGVQISARYFQPNAYELGAPELLECSCGRCGYEWVDAPCAPLQGERVQFGHFTHDLQDIPWPWPGDFADYMPHGEDEFVPSFSEVEEGSRAELQVLVEDEQLARAYLDGLGGTLWCMVQEGEDVDILCMHPEKGVAPIAHLSHVSPDTGLDMTEVGKLMSAAPELAKAVHHLHMEVAKLRRQILAREEH